jgi:hypothetical protein
MEEDEVGDVCTSTRDASSVCGILVGKPERKRELSKFGRRGLPCPDQLRGPPSLCPIGTGGRFPRGKTRQGRDADHSPPFGQSQE